MQTKDVYSACNIMRYLLSVSLPGRRQRLKNNNQTLWIIVVNLYFGNSGSYVIITSVLRCSWTWTMVRDVSGAGLVQLCKAGSGDGLGLVKQRNGSKPQKLNSIFRKKEMCFKQFWQKPFLSKHFRMELVSCEVLYRPTGGKMFFEGSLTSIKITFDFRRETFLGEIPLNLPDGSFSVKVPWNALLLFKKCKLVFFRWLQVFF